MRKKTCQKVRPSLAPARKKLLDETITMVESYVDTNLGNPPHFVYVDMHEILKFITQVEKSGLCATMDKNPRTYW